MVDQDTIKEIVRRIVEVAKPDRIILFGSRASGDASSGSDVDLLVVKSIELADCVVEWAEAIIYSFVSDEPEPLRGDRLVRGPVFIARDEP